MSTLSLKILSTLILLLISLIINFFIFHKNNDKYYKLIVLICVLVNLFFLLTDLFIFKNEFPNFLAYNLLLSFLLSITFEDVKTKLIDLRVIIGYFLAFLIYRIAFLNIYIILDGLTGCILCLIIMFIAYFIKRKSIGIGDIEVIAACGMIIGFPNIFHFLFKTFLFVFIFGIILMITKKKNLFTELPLAPFLLLATII